MGWYGMGV